MGIFAPYYSVDRSNGTVNLTGGRIGQVVTISYSYSPNIDTRSSSKHGNTHRIAELQRLVTKHPNRVDLKMELQRLQKTFSPKIGKRKKKK